MKNFGFKKFAGLLLVFALVFPVITAQEKNDAIKAFNEAVELMKSDPVGSIASFENCIKLCVQVGDSALDIQVKAEQVLPGLYYQKAYNVLVKDKNNSGGLLVSKQAMKVAEKYNNGGVKENINKLLVQAYSAMASEYVNKKEYENAILAFDSVLAINPGHLNALYYKALMYRGLNKDNEFEAAIDLYVSKLNPGTDADKLEQARKAARDYFRIAGGKANQAKKYADAIVLLDKAAKYGEDENICYQYASVYNKQNNRAKALEYAQKGLGLSTGTAEDKAKYYFEMAEAQTNLGKKTEACESYKNAKYGPFVQASDAQLKNLGCE
jgi:tetratricopeptide (TPR) repeat protein